MIDNQQNDRALAALSAIRALPAVTRRICCVRRRVGRSAWSAGRPGDRVYFETLEPRWLFTIVPLAASAAEPVVEGLIATDIHLPADAISPELFNVVFNGFSDYVYDYQPHLVQQPNGTYNIYTNATFSAGGTKRVSIDYQNKSSHQWPTLETGQIVVARAPFTGSAGGIEDYHPTYVAGLPTREAYAHFYGDYDAPSDLSATITFSNGRSLTARVEPGKFGGLDVFSDDVVTSADTSPAIRLYAAGNPKAVGYYGSSAYAYPEVGIGAFRAGVNTDGAVSVNISTNVWMGGFRPNGEVLGYDSTLSGYVLWQSNTANDKQPTTPAAITVTDKGVFVNVERPAGLPERYHEGMFFVTEQVQLPALGDRPAGVAEVSYVGSWTPDGATPFVRPAGRKPVAALPADSVAPADPATPTNPAAPRGDAAGSGEGTGEVGGSAGTGSGGAAAPVGADPGDGASVADASAGGSSAGDGSTGGVPGGKPVLAVKPGAGVFAFGALAGVDSAGSTSLEAASFTGRAFGGASGRSRGVFADLDAPRTGLLDAPVDDVVPLL